MKFLFSWLKEFIYFNIKKVNIYEIFTNIGLEVLYIKKIYPIKYKYQKNIIFGKILFIEKKNKKFKIKVETKKKKKIYIFHKVYILKNTKVLIEYNKKKKTYIIVCTDYEYDYIISTSITHNISYLSYYINLSNEIHSYLKYKNIKSKIINFNIINNKKKINKNKIIIKSNNILYYYSLIIKNIKIEKSNFYIQKKIVLSNIKPINNIIDIKNIIIKETGIPIEIMDLDKIINKKIIIKDNYKNINFYTYKKKKINIKSYNKDIIIYDDNNNPIYISGIINSNKTKITKLTKNILLSLAIYKKSNIRKTVFKYKLNTILSNIYKNKINLYKINITIYKIYFYFNNFKIQELYYLNNIKIKKKTIDIHYNYINNSIGIKIPKKKILKILYCLKYKIIKYNNYFISIEINNIQNIKSKIDIINDIIRFYGINNINNNNNKIIKISSFLIKKKIYFLEKIENIIIDILINYGFYEVINTPFIINNNYKKQIINDKKNISINIKKEKLKEQYYLLKKKLYYNMINNILYNINRKNNNIKIFERGNCFYKTKNNKIKEKKHIELLITKKKIKNEINYLYNLYNILDIIIEKIGIFKYSKNIYFNKKNFDIEIVLKYKKKKIITFGKIKKNMLKNLFDINQNVFYSIFYIKNIFKSIENKKKKYKKYHKNQLLKKDLSFIIDKKIYFDSFYLLSKKILKKKLVNLYLFDIYTKNLPKNKKSYSIRFILKNKYGIKKIYINKILNNLIYVFKKKLKAELKKK
ncbi:MAG: phenylalanine--tRNA ligase beta subunit-related protein [Candidatus Shikimatogenerans bostrichidophilus]|nr:MAG: phenylalanine--tRNA ligase beta subunit-related protein [Candidatus Shikimatogenerans bostrichidophilus]